MITVYPKLLAGKPLHIDNNVDCKITLTGRVSRLKYLQHRNFHNVIKLLPGKMYMDKRTGEVKERKFNAKTRQDNIKNARKSLQRGRDLINTNCINLNNIVWVTFTYAENMIDENQLYNDWKNFNDAYRRRIGIYEYIIAVEPQARGAWHIHAFLIFDYEPYIDYDLIRYVWGHGRVEVQYLRGDIDNLGAYLSAYLTNAELHDIAEFNGYHDINIVNCERNTKSYVKGQRIYMYPSNMKIFRASKNIKKPIEVWTTAEKARKKVSGDTLTYDKYVEAEIKTKHGDYTNIIYTEYYKQKNNQCQEGI